MVLAHEHRPRRSTRAREMAARLGDEGRTPRPLALAAIEAASARRSAAAAGSARRTRTLSLLAVSSSPGGSWPTPMPDLFKWFNPDAHSPDPPDRRQGGRGRLLRPSPPRVSLQWDVLACLGRVVLGFVDRRPPWVWSPAPFCRPRVACGIENLLEPVLDVLRPIPPWPSCPLPSRTWASAEASKIGFHRPTYPPSSPCSRRRGEGIKYVDPPWSGSRPEPWAASERDILRYVSSRRRCRKHHDRGLRLSFSRSRSS
jgi:hypothetical protein